MAHAERGKMKDTGTNTTGHNNNINQPNHKLPNQKEPTRNNQQLNYVKFTKSVSFGRDTQPDTKIAWSTPKSKGNDSSQSKGSDTSRTPRKLPSITYGSSEVTTPGDYVGSVGTEHTR